MPGAAPGVGQPPGQPGQPQGQPQSQPRPTGPMGQTQPASSQPFQAQPFQAQPQGQPGQPGQPVGQPRPAVTPVQAQPATPQPAPPPPVQAQPATPQPVPPPPVQAQPTTPQPVPPPPVQAQPATPLPMTRVTPKQPQDATIAAPDEPHMACLLLIGTSGSMTGQPIESINKALHRFIAKIQMDDKAKTQIDIAVVEFNNDARVVHGFTPVEQTMEPITLRAAGMHAMGAGIDMAIDLVKERSKLYNTMGTPMHRPWIFLITDGASTDNIDLAAARINEEETKDADGNLKFFALGVGDYDKAATLKLTNRVMELVDTDFEGIFNWISESLIAISASPVNDEGKLGTLPENARVVQ